MALDDREYMAGDSESRERKAAQYDPKQYRRGVSNANFWRRVQHGSSGSTVMPLLLAIVAGLFCWYMYSTGQGPKHALDTLAAMGRQAIEKPQTLQSNYAASDGAAGACDSTQELRSISTKWMHGDSGTVGRFVEFVNDTSSPLFVKVFDGGSSQLSQTLLLMAGERMRDSASTAAAQLELSTGTIWCNGRDGWKDARITRVEGNLVPLVGVTTLTFSEQPGTHGLAVGMAVPEPIRQALHEQALPARVAPPGSGMAPVYEPIAPPAIRNYQPRPQQAVTATPSPTHRLELQPSQRDQEAGLERQALAAAAERYQQGQWPAGMQLAPVAEEPPPQNVRVQDWRDVTAHDIRMVTSGGLHYIGGQVGEEDVQFQLSLHGDSAIGDSMARQVGASGCQRGQWLVLGRYWSTCRKLVQSMRFGNVTLENVLIAVLPGVQTPVLGRDLVGHAHIFTGHDGDYLRVGR